MNEVRPEMNEPIIVKAGTVIVEEGIGFNACVLAIALLGTAACMAAVQEPICYQVHHISPGSIVRELSAMLEMAANGQVTVFQRNVSGFVEQLIGAGTIYKTTQDIKIAFRDRDRSVRNY
ncbi:MAG: hypothetical protein ACPLRN_01590 [Microgenomates group bacterium]